MRVIDRGHRDPAIVRALAQPALASGFANRNVLVLNVAHLAHRRHTVNQHPAGFTGRQLKQRVVPFFGHQLGLCSGRARHLRAFARPQLDVVHRRARRDVPQWQRIAGYDIGVRPAEDGLANLQAIRVQDVAMFAVGIAQQRQPRRAVRVVLYGHDLRWNARLLALEINHAQLAFVPATAPPAGHVALTAAAAGAALAFCQRLERLFRRDLVATQCADEPSRRGYRSVSLNRHCFAHKRLGWLALPNRAAEVALRRSPKALASAAFKIKDSVRTRASSRPTLAARMLSSSPGDGRQIARAAAPYRERLRCALSPLSP